MRTESVVLSYTGVEYGWVVLLCNCSVMVVVVRAERDSLSEVVL